MKRHMVIGLTLGMIIILMYGCAFSNHLTGTSTAVGKPSPFLEELQNSSSPEPTKAGKGNLITPYTYQPNK